MGKQKEFYDKPLFSIINHITWFLLGGLYFILLNLPLIFFYTITSFDVNQFNIALLFICLIPFGVALGALYSTMSELVREKDISFSSYFFNSYKTHFRSNLKLWFIELVVLTILFIDFQYFYLNMTSYGIHIIFLILGIWVLILGLYAFPINCRFDMKLKDIIILSFYYSLKKFHITLLKSAILLIICLLIFKFNALLVLLIPSILCYVFAIYDKSILLEIEKNSLKNTVASKLN